MQDVKELIQRQLGLVEASLTKKTKATIKSVVESRLEAMFPDLHDDMYSCELDDSHVALISNLEIEARQELKGIKATLSKELEESIKQEVQVAQEALSSQMVELLASHRSSTEGVEGGSKKRGRSRSDDARGSEQLATPTSTQQIEMVQQLKELRVIVDYHTNSLGKLWDRDEESFQEREKLNKRVKELEAALRQVQGGESGSGRGGP